MFTQRFTGNLSFLSVVKRPASIALLLFLLVGFADGAMLPFFALWAQGEASIPVAWIGVLFGCYAGGEILATPFIGGIADRIGRRPVLLCSTLGVGLGFAMLYFSHGVFQAACVLLFIGVSESVLHPTIATVIADTIPGEKTRSYFSLARVMSNIGRAAGPAVGAVLVLHSLGTVFLGSAVALFACACLVALALPETRRAGSLADDDDDDEEGLASLLPAFRDRRLAGLLAWVVLLEMSSSWIEAVLPLYAHGAHTLTPSGVGSLFTYGALLVVVFQFPLTRMTRNASESTLIVASGVVLTMAFVALMLSSGLTTLIVAMTGFAFADMLFGPLVPAAVNAMAQDGNRATYMAAVSVANDIKDTVGPATGTALFAVGVHVPWVGGMAVAALAAWGLASSMRRSRGQDRRIP
ncbi:MULTISPECIES: MFS transporter [Luteibacter]|uniref:MFS transporter n=1 Tax=Luteibacter TaxID=242605 RepID=UPI000689B7ED|nr:MULTISPECIES: MFS transporter [unclassified Luteibacter]